MAVLIDTGVLLRLFERNDAHHPAIRHSLRLLAEDDERIVTAAQNIAEFWNVSTRQTSARGGFGHPVERVARRVAIIERFCEILTESEDSYRRWKQLVSDQGITGASVHDARLASIMLDHGIASVLTLNDADFRRYEGITAIIPSDV